MRDLAAPECPVAPPGSPGPERCHTGSSGGSAGMAVSPEVVVPRSGHHAGPAQHARLSGAEPGKSTSLSDNLRAASTSQSLNDQAESHGTLAHVGTSPEFPPGSSSHESHSAHACSGREGPSVLMGGSEVPGWGLYDVPQAPWEPVGLPEDAWELHELEDFFGPDAFGI